MTPADLFRAGQLRAALDAQVQEVRSNPADHARRLFLFELLAFAGEWDRARRQIEAITYPGEVERQTAIEQYRMLLDAEDHRARVFRDGVMPEFLVPPPRWLSDRLQAVVALKGGDEAGAFALIAKADEAAPPVTGTLNGAPADGLRDADDVFGPVLEVMAQGRYYWLPLEQVESLLLNPPKTPRDLIWRPAKLSIKDGPAGDVFLPTRYPDTPVAADDALKLGRATAWNEKEPLRGTGLRVFLAGDQAVNLLDWREYQAA